MTSVREHALAGDAGRPTLPPTGGPDRERWSIGLVLSRPLTDEERAEFHAHVNPRISAVCLRFGGDPMTIGATGFGSMDLALSGVVTDVTDALHGLGIRDISFIETWMVNHDHTESQADQQVIRYFGVTQCAQALGVSRQRVLQLAAAKRFPAPDALVGERPVWREATVIAFQADKNAASLN